MRRNGRRPTRGDLNSGGCPLPTLAVRFIGDPQNLADAEARLRAALPGSRLVSKAPGLFVLEAVAAELLGTVPSDWTIYEPTIADVDPPKFDWDRIKRSIGGE